MADGEGHQWKQIGLAVLLEFFGSIILGMGVSMLRYDGVRTLGWIMIPFWSWFAYSTCWRVSGGHLNPVLSVISLLRPADDRPDTFNRAAYLLYIPAQMLGMFLGTLCQWWLDQVAITIRFKHNDLTPNDPDDYYWSEPTWYEIFAAFIFCTMFLSQSSIRSAVSKDPGFQSFMVGMSYGLLVIYSYLWTGGCLNPFLAFNIQVWNAIDEEEGYDWQFMPHYFACNFAGGFIALAVHWAFAMKSGESKIYELEKKNAVAH